MTNFTPLPLPVWAAGAGKQSGGGASSSKLSQSVYISIYVSKSRVENVGETMTSTQIIPALENDGDGVFFPLDNSFPLDAFSSFSS